MISRQIEYTSTSRAHVKYIHGKMHAYMEHTDTVPVQLVNNECSLRLTPKYWVELRIETDVPLCVCYSLNNVLHADIGIIAVWLVSHLALSVCQ